MNLLYHFQHISHFHTERLSWPPAGYTAKSRPLPCDPRVFQIYSPCPQYLIISLLRNQAGLLNFVSLQATILWAYLVNKSQHFKISKRKEKPGTSPFLSLLKNKSKQKTHSKLAADWLKHTLLRLWGNIKSKEALLWDLFLISCKNSESFQCFWNSRRTFIKAESFYSRLYFSDLWEVHPSLLSRLNSSQSPLLTFPFVQPKSSLPNSFVPVHPLEGHLRRTCCPWAQWREFKQWETRTEHFFCWCWRRTRNELNVWL